MMAVSTRTPAAVFLSILLLALLIRKRISTFSALFFGLLCGVCIHLFWNDYRYGSPLAWSYSRQTFDANIFESIYAHLFSPGIGIIGFCPLAFVGAFALWFLQKKKKYLNFLNVSLLFWLFIFSAWWAYNGGLTYGPRFMLPILPILVVPGFLFYFTSHYNYKKIFYFTTLVLWGFYIQFNSILFPVNYHWHRWADSIEIWDVPVREKQLQLNVAERMAIFDPFYSNYFANFSNFWNRVDLWQLPFIKFKNRSYKTILHLSPDRDVHAIKVIARGSQKNPWVIKNIRISQEKKKKLIIR